MADDRELRREGPLIWWIRWRRLREDVGPETPLCLILGADAFRELHTWRRWRELTDWAHIVVMQRPGVLQSLPTALETFMAPRVLSDSLRCAMNPAGGILFQPVTQLSISATQIRALLAHGQSPRYLLAGSGAGLYSQPSALPSVVCSPP
jgi:nicotinate-nucleotide adenylyltransferase